MTMTHLLITLCNVFLLASVLFMGLFGSLLFEPM